MRKNPLAISRFRHKLTKDEYKCLDIILSQYETGIKHNRVENYLKKTGYNRQYLVQFRDNILSGARTGFVVERRSKKEYNKYVFLVSKEKFKYVLHFLYDLEKERVFVSISHAVSHIEAKFDDDFDDSFNNSLLSFGIEQKEIQYPNVYGFK